MAILFQGLPHNIPFNPDSVIEMSQQYGHYRAKIMAALIADIQDNHQASDLRYYAFEAASGGNGRYDTQDFVTWLQFACDYFEMLMIVDQQISEYDAVKQAAGISATYALIDVYNAYTNIVVNDDVVRRLQEASHQRDIDRNDIKRYVYNQQPQQQRPSISRSVPMGGGRQHGGYGGGRRQSIGSGSSRASELITSNERVNARNVGNVASHTQALSGLSNDRPALRPTRGAMPVAGTNQAVAKPQPVQQTVTKPEVEQNMNGKFISSEDVGWLSKVLPFAYDANVFTMVFKVSGEKLLPDIVKVEDDVEYAKHEYRHLITARSAIPETNKKDAEKRIVAENNALTKAFGEKLTNYLGETIISDIKSVGLAIPNACTYSSTRHALATLAKENDLTLPLESQMLTFLNVSDIVHEFDQQHESIAAMLTQAKDFNQMITILATLMDSCGVDAWSNINHMLTKIANRVLASIEVEPLAIDSFCDDIIELLEYISSEEYDRTLIEDFLMKEIVNGAFQTDYSAVVNNCKAINANNRYILQVERIVSVPVMAHQINIAASAPVSRLTSFSTPELFKLVTLLFTSNRFISRMVFQTMDNCQFYVYRSPHLNEYIVTTNNQYS